MSNLSGFIGPYVTGAIETATGSYTYALLTIAVIICLGIVVLLTAGRRAERLGQGGEYEHPVPEVLRDS